MALTSKNGVEQKLDRKSLKRGSSRDELKESRPVEREEEGGENVGIARHVDKKVIVCVCVCVSAHMPVHVLLMKLMEIEPLKALSPFCSGGQLVLTQTKTKPSQPVSLPFIIVRATAAALPVSPQNPPSVCVFVSKNHSHRLKLYFSKEAIYDYVREIKLRKTEENRRHCWKEANFILAEYGWPEG